MPNLKRWAWMRPILRDIRRVGTFQVTYQYGSISEYVQAEHGLSARLADLVEAWFEDQ